MIRSGLILMIRQKVQAGQSSYSIGKELGISKNTAKKYSTGELKEHGLKGRVKPSKLDRYRQIVDTMMGSGIFNCVVIHERLQDLGYGGGITIIKDYVKNLRPARSAPADDTKLRQADRRKWTGESRITGMNTASSIKHRRSL